jgi:hypothetical protein
MPLALVLVAALCGGCGTLDNIKRPTFAPPNKPDAQVVRVYGGVHGDWAIMTHYDWSRTASYLDYAFIPLMAGADLVFDVVGDTVTLPYTLVAEARRATRRPNATDTTATSGTPVTTAGTPASTPSAPSGSTSAAPLPSTPVTPAAGRGPVATTPPGR